MADRTPIERLGDAIEAALDTAPAADVLTVITIHPPKEPRNG